MFDLGDRGRLRGFMKHGILPVNPLFLPSFPGDEDIKCPKNLKEKKEKKKENFDGQMEIP